MPMKESIVNIAFLITHNKNYKKVSIIKISINVN